LGFIKAFDENHRFEFVDGNVSFVSGRFDEGGDFVELVLGFDEEDGSGICALFHVEIVGDFGDCSHGVSFGVLVLEDIEVFEGSMEVGGICTANFECSHFGVCFHSVFDSTAATLEDEVEKVGVMIFALVNFVGMVFCLTAVNCEIVLKF